MLSASTLDEQTSFHSQLLALSVNDQFMTFPDLVQEFPSVAAIESFGPRAKILCKQWILCRQYFFTIESKEAPCILHRTINQSSGSPFERITDPMNEELES